MKLPSIIALAVTLPVTLAQAQTPKDIAGCWSLQSAVLERGGQKLDLYGPDPVGQFMFTEDGHMSLIQMRRNLPQGVSGEPANGAVTTFVAYFGTYDLKGKKMTIDFEGATRSDWRNEKTLTRTIESVSASELVYMANPDQNTTVRLVAKPCASTKP